MRKSNQEISDRSIIEEILSGSEICRLGMLDNGRPYILPFNYGYHNQCIYIHAAPEGKKIDLLKKNNRVCFEIEYRADIIKDETACSWSELYRSVLGYGQVEIITDYKAKLDALEIIMKHNGYIDKPEFQTSQVSAVVILKLNIAEVTGKQSGNWSRLIDQNKKEITTDRLHLKEVDWNDLEEIHHLHLFPEVDKFNTLGIPDNLQVTEKQLKFMIDSQTKIPRSAYEWKIVSKESDKFIGLAGFFLSNNKFKLGEIYYKLLPEFWGRGYATEIARKLIKVGFEDFDLQKVEAGVATRNEASIRVLEKAGMTREGLRRKILPIRGTWVDNYHYAIVRGDKLK